MRWNWQQPDWPNFSYQGKLLESHEKRFWHHAGLITGIMLHITDIDNSSLVVEIMSDEALKTSAIEGEVLNRNSIRASILRNLGIKGDNRRIPAAEQGVAAMISDLHKNYAAKLTDELLFDWHIMLMNGRRDINDIGAYRTDTEPMQIVSGNFSRHKIHFEAPPSKQVTIEMKKFIAWFNATAPNAGNKLPTLIRAAIAHLYFEIIHPFEDGNGRIGRALVEKVLSQALGYPSLIALSQVIDSNKKDYYCNLEDSSRTNDISSWLLYFADVVLAAQQHTQDIIEFVVKKNKFYSKCQGNVNVRQKKVIDRVLREGIKGFAGGLSAENYIKITNTSRATATRDLQDLVAKKLFVRTGELKGARYWMNL